MICLEEDWGKIPKDMGIPSVPERIFISEIILSLISLKIVEFSLPFYELSPQCKSLTRAQKTFIYTTVTRSHDYTFEY